MNRELTQDECRDQRTLLKILERNNLAEWLGGAEFYDEFRANLFAMQTTGTTDGEDLAELTDEDAKERPWVMCRDEEDQDWRGPHKLIAVKETHIKNVVIRKTESGVDLVTGYKFARQLTQQEKERYRK